MVKILETKDLSPTELERRGSVRELLGIALPMMISQACETFMMFASRAFLAQIKPEYMAAATSGGISSFVFATFFLGIIGFGTALVAQNYGAGNKKNCPAAATQSIIIALAAYPFIIACIPLGHVLFVLMDVPANQIEPQTEYFDILMYGSIIALLRNCLAGFFSGIGRTRIVMISTGVALVVSVFANYALIFGEFGMPALEMTGAAIGMLVGSFAGLIVLIFSFLGPGIVKEFDVLRGLRYDRALMGKLLRFGYPSGIEFFLNMLAFNLLLLNLQSYGPDASEAVSIAFSWDTASFIPLIGVGIGITSLVGRYMGAGKPDMAHKAAMSGLKVAVTYTSITFLTFLLFADPLVRLFQPNSPAEAKAFEEIHPLAVFMVRLVSVYVFSDAMAIVFGSALRGAGDTFWTMAITVGGDWALVTASFIFVKVLVLSPEISWLIFVGMVVILGLLLFLRYRTGRWRLIKVVEGEGGW